MAYRKRKGISVKLMYGNIAEDYDDCYHSSKIKKTVTAEDIGIKNLVPYENQKRILDCGCGTGYFLDIFDVPKTDYLGVDLSSEMLEIARSKHKGYKFHKADIMDFQFGFFDLIVSLFSIPDYCGLEIIEKAFDMLEPRGIFACTFINKDGGYEKIYCLDQAGYEYEPHVFTYEQIQQAFRRCGYGVVYICGFSNNKKPNGLDTESLAQYYLDEQNNLDGCKYYFAMGKKL